MKRFLILFLILNFNLYSQKEENINLFAKSYPDSMLIHKQTGDTIHGLEIKFNQLIKTVLYDSSTNNLLVYLNLLNGNTGGGKDHFIANYNLDSNKFLWKKSFNPLKKSYFYFDNQLLLNLDDGAEYLSLDSHKLLKKLRGKIFYDPILYEKGIGLGYNKVDYSKSRLFGYNAKSGDTLWVNQLERMPKDIINEGILIDSHYMFFNNYLYGINIYNGKVWKYEFDFYKYIDQNGSTYSYMIGGLLGYAFYTILTSTNHHNYNIGIKELYYPNQPNHQTFNYSQEGYDQQCSNLLFQKNKLSIALDNSLLSMNINGEDIKNISFPEGVTACHSNLFEIKEKLYLINYGFFKYGNALFCSAPFIMKFSKDKIEKTRVFSDKYKYEEINKIYQDSIELISNSKILGFKVDSEQIVIVFDKGLSIFDFDFNTKKSKSFSKKETKNWNNVEYDEVFISLNDDKVEKIQRDTVINILNLDNSIHQYNYKFELINSYNASQIFTTIYKDPDISFISDKYKYNTIVLNSKNQKIFELVNVKSVEFRNNKYYIGLGDIVYIVDKKELVK